MKKSFLKNIFSFNGIKLVLGTKKYFALFFCLAILFTVFFIFEWNLILFPYLYVRADLWTVQNLVILLVISILSGLAVTLNIFELKAKAAFSNATGLLSIIPAFFGSACPGCAPLLLSFSSTTFAIGLSLQKFGTAIKAFSFLILLVTILYLSSKIGKCGIIPGEKK